MGQYDQIHNVDGLNNTCICLKGRRCYSITRAFENKSKQTPYFVSNKEAKAAKLTYVCMKVQKKNGRKS